MKFKAGDKVEVIEYGCKEYNGLTGVVQGYETDLAHTGETRAIIKADRGKYDGTVYFFDRYLRLIPQPSEFKVGDRVKVIKNIGPAFADCTLGHEGIIHRDDGPGKTSRYAVQIEGRNWVFNAQELQLLSPQSPQPQTTEPKEDTMKPYAVIYHDLNTGATAQIQSHHTTEAEAKESAELLVAGQRGNKRYFAITIVNTKTGKLVGSVVDAPPAVEWNKE